MTHYKIIYFDYLSHHGILGQKWGKRNGPPYPLGVSDHSSSEKKAGWRKSLDRKKNSKSDKKSSFKLTDKQKKYIKVGLAVGATCLLAYGATKISSGAGINGGEVKKLLRLVKNRLDLHYKSGLNYIKGSHARKTDLKLCNKNWDPHGSSKGNCMNSVIAYTLRRLGFDVTALGGNGMSARDLDKVFKGSLNQSDILKFDRLNPEKQIKDWVLANVSDDKAIGYVGYDRPNSDTGGHVFAWEKNGDIILLRDTQSAGNSNTMLRIIRSLKDPSKVAEEFIISRLDNCAIDINEILKHVENIT